MVSPVVSTTNRTSASVPFFVESANCGDMRIRPSMGSTGGRQGVRVIEVSFSKMALAAGSTQGPLTWIGAFGIMVEPRMLPYITLNRKRRTDAVSADSLGDVGCVDSAGAGLTAPISA